MGWDGRVQSFPAFHGPGPARKQPVGSPGSRSLRSSARRASSFGAGRSSDSNAEVKSCVPWSYIGSSLGWRISVECSESPTSLETLSNSLKIHSRCHSKQSAASGHFNHHIHTCQLLTRETRQARLKVVTSAARCLDAANIGASDRNPFRSASLFNGTR